MYHEQSRGVPIGNRTTCPFPIASRYGQGEDSAVAIGELEATWWTSASSAAGRWRAAIGELEVLADLDASELSGVSVATAQRRRSLRPLIASSSSPSFSRRRQCHHPKVTVRV